MTLTLDFGLFKRSLFVQWVVMAILWYLWILLLFITLSTPSKDYYSIPVWSLIVVCLIGGFLGNIVYFIGVIIEGSTMRYRAQEEHRRSLDDKKN